MSKSVGPAERETAITMCDAFKRCTIYSEQRVMIGRVRRLALKHPEAVVITREGTHGRTPYIEADMPASFVGLRAAKYVPSAGNGNPSPMRDHPLN